MAKIVTIWKRHPNWHTTLNGVWNPTDWVIDRDNKKIGERSEKIKETVTSLKTLVGFLHPERSYFASAGLQQNQYVLVFGCNKLGNHNLVHLWTFHDVLFHWSELALFWSLLIQVGCLWPDEWLIQSFHFSSFYDLIRVLASSNSQQWSRFTTGFWKISASYRNLLENIYENTSQECSFNTVDLRLHLVIIQTFPCTKHTSTLINAVTSYKHTSAFGIEVWLMMHKNRSTNIMM